MFDLTMIEAYIAPLILIACLCVGYVVKNVIKTDAVNRYIPLIVLVLGAVLNVWFEGVFTLPVIVVGMVSGLASTGFYELIDTTILNVRKACGLPCDEKPVEGESYTEENNG